MVTIFSHNGITVFLILMNIFLTKSLGCEEMVGKQISMIFRLKYHKVYIALNTKYKGQRGTFITYEEVNRK